MKIVIISMLFISFYSVATQSKTHTNKTEVVITEVVKTQAKHWQIKPLDYIKATKLKQQYKSLISDNITPIEVLGIFAKTKQERKKYAQKFARLMYDTTAKVLTFQKAVNQANKKLHSGSMFDYIPKRNRPKQSLVSRASQVINLNNCSKLCLNKAKNFIDNAAVIPIDFYFKNATKKQIQKWAYDLNISLFDVENKTITLNHAQ